MLTLAGLVLLIETALVWLLEQRITYPLQIPMAWLTWGMAMVLVLAPIFTLRKHGRVKQGESYVRTQQLVDSGLYAIVRHPQYLGWMIMHLVLVLFNARWQIAVVAFVGAMLVFEASMREEKALLERFGDAYERYSQQVPHMNFIQGVRQWWKRRG